MVETNLPVLFFKDEIIFPFNELRIEFNNDSEKIILDNAENYNDNHILLCNLTDPLEENLNIKDFPNIGVLGKIKSKIDLPNGAVRVVITGVARVEILNYIQNNNDYFEAFTIPIQEYNYNETEVEALKRILYKDLNNYINTSSLMTNSVLGRIEGVENISKLTDIIISELPLDYKNKLKYLNEKNPLNRLKEIIEDLNRELETTKLENELEQTLKEKLDDSQREYILREKIRIIKEELGETDIKESDVSLLKDKIEKLEAPEKVKEKLNQELTRYELTSEASPEVTIIRTYIDWLLNLPWQEKTIDNYKSKNVKEVLNESHYGLEKIKERIIEQVVVTEYTHKINSPIICLVGPPGTGKTTLAKSIAKALNKKFVKISVGGVNDEAEIMGHRRTYIGANPGKIIQGLKKVGVNNPVFLIDEIDKLTKDYHGDPAAALLDILDKEQNQMFVDNYIEEEFDLSNVMFILTANNASEIPAALKDRLEIIELTSYTTIEKKEIAKKYLIPKLFKEYKIRDNNVSISDKAILKIINDYTKESGARELERQISTICRKVICNEIYDTIIKEKDLDKYLGKEKYYHSVNEKNTKSGIVNAVAYTPYGGEVLKVSVAYYNGKGEVLLTGSLGDIMKESINIAMSYIKSNSEKFDIDYKLFQENDFHIHLEDGATPKDGPSAGIAIVTSILSLLKDCVIDSNISMTGEITLRGKILPVGGLKEKLIAASVNNIKKVFIPIENKNDLEDIPKEVKNKVEVTFVRDYLDVYYYLFNSKEK